MDDMELIKMKHTCASCNTDYDGIVCPNCGSVVTKEK